MKIYALMHEVNDGYDIGTHPEVLQLFVLKEIAEQEMHGLIGKPKTQNQHGNTARSSWWSGDLEIWEMDFH